ncbi:MAG: DEAH-box RNA helicase prp16, partial [Watsoniomyces obsoletus]
RTTGEEGSVGFTASNIRFSIGPTAYVIPSVEIRGTNLSRDELASLLDPGSALRLADRMSRLAASEIVIPEIRAETTAGAVRQSAVYRDVRVAQIGAGRAASAASGGGSFDGTSAEGPSRGTFARMEISDIDLGLMVALLEPQPDATPAELRRVYGAFSLEGLTTEGPKGARSRIARMAGREFRARPTQDGWIATANAFVGGTDLSTASPAERGRVVGAMVDFFEAFEIGSVEATGIEFSDAGGKDAAGRIGRIAYESGTRGGEFRIEALEAGGDDGRVRMASFSVGGISLAPMLASARELAGKPEIGPAEMRRLIPIVGSVRLTGLDVSTK